MNRPPLFDNVLRRASNLLMRYLSAIRDALKRSRLGCFIAIHDWQRWRMKFPKMDIQNRRCSVCRAEQIREKPMRSNFHA